ncbi:MAG: hypothetical protein LBE30_12785 [Comamonas sp.]|jgi:hypothetical protein|nr:hypothetical protein [Comamonas sp.]
MQTKSTIEQHTLTPGNLLTLRLPEGSTLLCLGAAIQLSTTPLPSLDACSGYQMQLHNGQSWRAPGALWVQLLCVDERSRIQLQMNPAAIKENRLGLTNLRRWMVLQWSAVLRKTTGNIKRGRRAV